MKRLFVLAFVLSGAIGACADGLTSLSEFRASIVGNWTARSNFGAITFTTIQDDVTTDWLDRGATLAISIASDGTTAGRLFVPGGDEDGSDLDADLVGTWSTLGDSIVEFDHVADTFVRDMPFRLVEGELLGRRDFGDVTVVVTLVRQ